MELKYTQIKQRNKIIPIFRQDYIENSKESTRQKNKTKKNPPDSKFTEFKGNIKRE